VAATMALGLIGDRGAASRLVGILKSRQSDSVVRACAATALGKIGDDAGLDVVGLLRKLILTDNDDDVRRATALVLHRFLDGEKVNAKTRTTVLELLDRVARNDADAVTRGFAMIGLAQALHKGGDAREREMATTMFGQRLRGGDGREQGYAAVALGLLGRVDRDCAKPLREAFRTESDDRQRSAVAIGLGLMKDVASKKDIAAVVAAQGNPDLRGYCCVALGLLGENDPGVTKYLVEIVQHVNVPELKAAAALALAKLGTNREAIDTLKEALKDRNRYFKMSAIMALGYFRDWGTVKDLQDMVSKETNPEAKAIGVVALGYIGEGASVPVLKQISEDFNYLAVFLQMKSVDQIIRLF
jgi:HEAT repeat protein